MAKKKRTAPQETAGDTLVVFEPFVWNHHKWLTTGDPFICPSDVPGGVFKGFMDDRLIGPESARKVDEITLAQLVEKQMMAKASDDSTKFKHQAEKVTEEALKNGGTIASGDIPADAVSAEEVQAKIVEEEEKMGWGS